MKGKDVHRTNEAEASVDLERTVETFNGLFKASGQDKSKGKKKGSFLSKILKLNIKSVLGNAFAYIIQSLPVYVRPIVSANIINIATVAVGTGAMTTALWNELLINMIVLFASLIQNIFSTSWRYSIASRMIRGTGAAIKCSVVRKLQQMSLNYQKELETGRVQSKFIKDTETVDNFLGIIMHNFIPCIIALLISIGISIYKNGVVALFFLFIAPINLGLTNIFRKKIKQSFREYRVSTENMGAKMNTMLEMIPVTKSHGLEGFEIKNVENTIKNVQSAGIKIDKIQAIFGASCYVLYAILDGLNICFCAIMAIFGYIQIGDIVLFQNMFSQMNANFQTLLNVVPQIASGKEALDSISEIMNVDDVELNSGKREVANVSGNVVFENVYYKYPDADSYVIKNFNLNVKNGECIAVVGSSGSGKSTLMNMIIGLMLPTEGSLSIDGNKIDEFNLSEYRSHISVVPQNSILFSGTIRENITYGLAKYSEEDLQRVVDMANVREFLHELPNGLDTEIGEHGGKLSGGQKQRITIARALIRNPKILILDEATSALDNISELHVQKAISASIRGRTTFIVAHRLSTIRDADRIVVMENGECVEIGSYAELMEKKGKFYELKNLNEINIKRAETELS